MDVDRLCAEMVRIRSENPPGNTEEIIHFIMGYLDGLGVRTMIIANRGGRYNLVSAEKGYQLLLCGHVDVVPAMADGWKFPPFSGTIHDGYVWGRGSTDMKGGCAAFLAAYRSLLDSGEEPDAGFAFVCDEETSGTNGIQCLLSRGLIRPCDCIIAEPTPALHPNIGQKGLCRLDLQFRGVPGHGSLYPVRGVSAVMEAYSTLEYLKTLHQRVYDPGDGQGALIEASSAVIGEVLGITGAGDILRRIMYNPGRIEGGEKANIVAQHCDLELDLRIPWGCSIPELIDDIIVHSPNASAVVRSLSEPSLTPPDKPLVRTVCREISRVYGADAEPVVQWAASDARYLRKEGYQVIEYGPGEITLLHAVDERVAIDQLYKACEVYRGVMHAYRPVGSEDII